jgi:phospholipid/cholesterol/gamma-HCH transport system substrate-binding protein
VHHLTVRRQHVLTGAIALLLLFGSVSVGIKGAFGAFDGGYELVGSFDAAGQGLLPGSDVKVRGVNIGQVRSIELVHGRALVKLRIKDGEEVPTEATAVIRPKTLFGEKFVDIDPGETEESGPFLDDGDELTNTLGGFELEEVLTDVYPLLRAIDPAELMTVLGELAKGGDGLGESINRSIVNGEELTTLFADNAELTAQFLEDFAAVSEQLALSAEDLLALADAGNAALPTLNEHEEDLIDLLQQTGRLSSDVADLLEHNEAFVNASLGDGSRTIQLLFDRRDQVMPLVVGLRQYVRTLSESVRIDLGDGTLMAAVKGVLGGEACAVIPCPGTASAPAPPDEAAAATPTHPVSLPGFLDQLLPRPTDIGGTASGDDLFGFLSKVLGG